MQFLKKNPNQKKRKMIKGELLSGMLLFVTSKHHGQFDKGGTPYILHPLKVMYKLKTEDEELMCIALGHDVIEDTDATYEDLWKIPGMTQRVIDGIRALTKQPGQTYEEYKAGVFANVDAMRVKIRDVAHNMDPRRMKGRTEKDEKRTIKYSHLFHELKERLIDLGLYTS